MPTRNATAVWEGGLKGGRGSFNGENGTIGGKYTAGSRFENDPGSNPEELLAAAEAACFSMALSGALEKAGATPRRIETKAACTVDRIDGRPSITTMRVETRVAADGISAEELSKIAESVKDGCPVSRALRGNVQLEVSAQLV